MNDQNMILHKFIMKLEDAVLQVNKEAIKPMVPSMDIETILPVAITIAKVRGRYLAEMFEIFDQDNTTIPSDDQIEKLRQYRLAYEEAVSAFQTMEHAIDLGYLDIEGG